MKVAELRQRLQTLAGNDPEVDALLNVLETLDDLSIADLCEKIASGKVKKKKATASKATKTAVSSSTNELGVARYLEELHATKNDNASFEAVIRRLEKDKTIKAPEAQIIAERFIGQAKKYPSKPKAIKAILDRQISDRRDASRGPQISGLF